MTGIIKNFIHAVLNFFFKSIHPPGHFYSPVISKKEIFKREATIFDDNAKTIPGIELNEKNQLELLDSISKKYYKEIPFTNTPKEGLRYFFNNSFYCHSDGIFLYSVLRHCTPKKLIEIGSGFSSAAILDTNDLFLNKATECHFIDPYPNRLKKLLKTEDYSHCNIIQNFIQDVDVDMFRQLEENDILLIDSSHVSKTGSDVNHIIFKILPILKKGVLIHFHDIFFPFEYPKEWIKLGISWNEAYLLRAFLMNNSDYKIILYNTFLIKHHTEWFEKNMPTCLENTGGSIWLQKN